VGDRSGPTGQASATFQPGWSAISHASGWRRAKPRRLALLHRLASLLWKGHGLSPPAGIRGGAPVKGGDPSLSRGGAREPRRGRRRASVSSLTSRVAAWDHRLEPGSHSLAMPAAALSAGRSPASPATLVRVSCHHCIGQFSSRLCCFAERQRQSPCARGRGEPQSVSSLGRWIPKPSPAP